MGLDLEVADCGGEDHNLYYYDHNANATDNGITIDFQDSPNSDSLDDDNDEDLADAGPSSGAQVWDPNLDPFVGMEFDSEQSARFYYNAYARRIGFSTRCNNLSRSMYDKCVVARRIVCSRQGFRRKRKDRETKLPRKESRVGCMAEVNFKRQSSGKWQIIKFEKEHNHELVPPDEVHSLRSHRRIAGPARSLIDTLQAAGLGAAGVMSVLIKESGGVNNVGFRQKDCQNYMAHKTRSLGASGQLVFDYLDRMREKDSGFYYAVQGDPENSSAGNVFWVDSKSIKNYACFGDTVIFDTTYRINCYKVPFASFTGWNHHGQPLLFGCALLLSESEASFVWLFQNWLTAMSGCCPKSITTDHDPIIGAAVAEVFPQACHRSCKWIVFREAQEILADVYFANPNFETEFQRIINKAESVEEFEKCWEALTRRYNLESHEWLQSTYKAREQWAPVYFRDTFFGDAVATQSRSSMSSYFDGYINASTNITRLIQQYEKAVTNQRDREIKTDYEELNIVPDPRTPSPMEKQAANIYTSNVFKVFQEELLETLSYTATVSKDTGLETVYRVAKFGEYQKGHLIKFDVFEKKADCSCRMFEFSGVVCRHILAVFKVTNVLTLPSQYFIRRWRRNARDGLILDQNSIGVPNFRYKNLCQEAIEFVKGGAESARTYKAAMDALHVAATKVADAKKSGLMFAPHQNVNGCLLPCSNDQDKKIQELTSALEKANQQCEAYQTKLFAVVKDMEEEKLKIAMKVRNTRLNITRTDSEIS